MASEMNRKIIIYGNGSSGNHGCEAIYRGTAELLKEKLLIQSESVLEDKKYGVDQIAELNNAIDGNPSAVSKMDAYLKLKFQKRFVDMDGIRYLPSIRKIRSIASTALSAGGDNYCYGYPELYAYLNKAYKKEGLKTVLWGCSVEPALMKDERVVKDLNTYDLIVARESITYKAISSIGANVIYCPDPAFFMKPEKIETGAFFSKDTVGINCSPMIINNEKHKGAVYRNYSELISYILRETDMNIALIPHVVWDKNDDRIVLKKLYEEFKDSSRIQIMDDQNAPQLKYLISKCRYFIGSRTHATIAAYSTAVPTLTVGYSVKAKGIAKDLFGNDKNYMISAQSLQEETDLTKMFISLLSDGELIRNQLRTITADYPDIAKKAAEQVKSL